MHGHTLASLTRRLAIGTVATAAACMARPATAQALPITLRGIVGGGLARFATSEAHFSLFATRIHVADDTEDVILGSVLWVDTAAGSTLMSAEITAYEAVTTPDGNGETRRIRGMMQLSDGILAPFVLRVTDAGHPASGGDTIALLVGEGAGDARAATPATTSGFSYAAAGPIVEGNVQDIDVVLPSESAASVDATVRMREAAARFTS